MGPPGAYASVRTVCAATAVPIPQNIPDELAAAVLLKGMTTEFLVERCARIAPGQSALVHAAAGGVGSLLVQWLKAAGVEVFAHAGSEAKADAVRSEEHTSELQSLMRISYAVFCLKKKNNNNT